MMFAKLKTLLRKADERTPAAVCKRLSTILDQFNRLAAALQEARVRFSIRRGLIRFGLHLYNDETDVAKVAAVAKEAVGR